MELSERIRRVIKSAKDAGRNQKAVADYIGVNSSSITHWKNGETKSLKLDNLYRMADFTGFSARWIAIGEGPERSAELPGVQLTSQEAMLLSLFRDLDEVQQSALFGAMYGMKNVETPSSVKSKAKEARHPKTKDARPRKAAG